MGKVLLFPQTSRPESAQVETDRDAELVMFPGVRYERSESDETQDPDARRKRESGS